ncbi:hypothetical protein DRQ18_05580 [bacterium]|nr:MAG: hypothetical protein DRQ18_05580 [bacterium]
MDTCFYLSFLASCMVPGAGQFYRGSIGKGAALLLGSFCFSEWNYRKGGILPKVGLGVMYFLSVTDALLYLFQHR